MQESVKFVIHTDGIGQKSGTLIISEEAVSFAGKSINICDLSGIAGDYDIRTEVLYTTINTWIKITAGCQSLDIKISGSNFMFSGRADKALESYKAIKKEIIYRLGAQILSSLVKAIQQGETIVIGDLKFNSLGVTGRNQKGVELRALWTFSPETRGTDSFSEVVFHSPLTGEVIKIGGATHNVTNGFIIPYLVKDMKRIYSQ